MNKTTFINIISTKNYEIINDTKLIKDNPEEFLYCENNLTKKILIAKEYTEINSKIILEDVSRVKKILRSNNYNIWNSYFLILLSISDITKSYTIERNSKGLRKYVINEASDLYRIPFIKEESSGPNELNFSKSLNEILSTDDPDLKEIYDWMIKKDASYTDLGSREIQNKVNEIMKEWWNENK